MEQAARGASGGALQSNNSNPAYSDSTYNGISFNSDGFTIMTGGSTPNMSAAGETYVYAAFADRPGNNWDVNNLIATAGLETANEGFDVVTYSGNSSTQNITGLDFQPDLVWIKTRDDNSYHFLTDSVRGVNKHLASNATDAEGSVTAVTAFNSDGFSLANQANVNDSAYNYVAWCWRAGGTAVSNTDGSVTTSISASTTYGFSIVSWTGDGSSGASLGHGLGSTPKWVICKRRNNANVWVIAHAGMGTNNMQFTNETPYSPSSASGGGGISLGNSTTITTVEGTSSSVNSNASGGTYIAYCWSEISGFSKFDSYSGSGVSGNTVTTGFKPRFLIIKRTDMMITII